MNRILTYLLSALFPSICHSCSVDLNGNSDRYLCSDCISKIEKKTRLENFSAGGLDGLISAGLFEGPIRDLIHALKYRGKDYLASYLAEIWLKRTVIGKEDIDLVVPVPSTFLKLIRRGFNQSELIARPIAAVWTKPLYNHLLRRNFWSTTQIGRSRFERLENADSSYQLRSFETSLSNRTILLVDDVCTTAATLNTCAFLLKRRGAKRVYGAVIARELLNSSKTA